MTNCTGFHPSSCIQGSELAGWAMGRYSYEGIDMNHNFADLNSGMWTAIELETDHSKLINHYFPIPEQYTSEEAFVSFKYTYHILEMSSKSISSSSPVLPLYLLIQLVF